MTSQKIALLERPTRWQQPFGPDMTDEVVDDVLKIEPFASLNASKFPKSTPLTGVLKYEARIVTAEPGQIIIRDGEYGNSAFVVLEGLARVILDEHLPEELLGRAPQPGKSYWKAFSQLWNNNKHPEARKLSTFNAQNKGQNTGNDTHVTIDDVDRLFDEYHNAPLGVGTLFGELAAIGRVPRTATIVADQETRLIEIRWQGIREIMRYDKNFKQDIEQRYRKNALFQHLAETEFFEDLPEKAFSELVDKALFETHGSFDWYISYKRGKLTEPRIASEGDYPDGLLIIRAGFARVSKNLGAGKRTLTYLGAGDIYGIHEVYEQSQGKETRLETSLTALGYVDLIRIPLPLLKEYVFPNITIPKKRLVEHKHDLLERSVADDWLLDNRFMNATQAMVIDLDKCVRCDDCVQACSSTHDDNPRFKRHGKTYNNWMVTNACMHCLDPVCMIGCPTGAIHRSSAGGEVIINDKTCIGCGTCANACPYDNITLIEIADENGDPVFDPNTEKPILKATKCDLCHTNPGGPACVAACPHDALFRTGFSDGNILNESAFRVRKND